MAMSNISSLIPGETWLSGVGVPNPNFGYKTQFYLNESNGDVYQKTDTLVWTLVGSIASGGGGGGVTSVNGETGVVLLDAADVGAIPTGDKGVANGVASLDGTGKVPSGQLPTAPVVSVNTKTGAVTLNAADVGALSTTGGTVSGTITAESFILNSSSITTLSDTTTAVENFCFFSSGTSGTTNSSLVIGNDIYVGGLFNRVGKISDLKLLNGCYINGSTATANLSIPFSLFDATITCSHIIGNDIYVGGYFNSYNNQLSTKLVKISLLTGQIDSTFDVGSAFQSGAAVFDITSDGAGNIFVAGSFSSYKGVTRFGIIKLNALTAALDTTFNAGLVVGIINRIIHNSSSIYMGGALSSCGGTPIQNICKISAVTGAIDPTFSTTTGPNSDVKALYIDGSGNLIIGGSFSQYKGTSRQYIAKINASTAALDATFDSAVGFSNSVQVVRSDGSGNLLVGGSFTSYKGSTRQRIAKIDGTTAALIGTFNSSSGFNSTVADIALDPSDGKIIVTGFFTSYGPSFTARKYCAKINTTTAALDTTFDTSTTMDGNYINTVSINSAGSSVFIGGQFADYGPSNNLATRANIVKINLSTGVIDSVFNSVTGTNDTVRVITHDSGNLFIGGNFTTYKGSTRQRIAKINASTAALDATFDSSTGFDDTVNDIVLRGSDIYVGGNFSSYKSLTRGKIAKVNAVTAALDSTFNPFTGFDNNVNSILVNDADNSVFAAGNFQFYSGIPAQYIIKLDATTAVKDSLFDVSTGFNGNVNKIIFSGAAPALILAGGNFSQYKGINRLGAARIYQVEASLDLGFDTSTGFFDVYGLVADGSGSVFACGAFDSYKGTARQKIVKINETTAALDTTFDSSTGIFPSTRLTNISLDNNGNIFVGTDLGNTISPYKGYLAVQSVRINKTNANYLSSAVVPVSSYTLQSSDNGKVIVVNSASSVTLTVPAGLSTGYQCRVIRSGIGQVTFSSSGTTLNSKNGLNISSQHGTVWVFEYSSDIFNLSGDTSV